MRPSPNDYSHSNLDVIRLSLPEAESESQTLRQMPTARRGKCSLITFEERIETDDCHRTVFFFLLRKVTAGHEIKSEDGSVNLTHPAGDETETMMSFSQSTPIQTLA